MLGSYSVWVQNTMILRKFQLLDTPQVEKVSSNAWNPLLTGLVEFVIGVVLLGLASKRIFGIGQVGSPPGFLQPLTSVGIPVDTLFPWVVLIFQILIGLAAVYSGIDSFRDVRRIRQASK